MTAKATKVTVIGDRVAVCQRLAENPETKPRVLANAAWALLEERDRLHAVPLLLELLARPLAVVRAGAIRGLSAHPFPAVLSALVGVTQHDGSKIIRRLAEQALDIIDSYPIDCIQCGGEGAKLAPEPSFGPAGDPLPKPMFCDRECAAEWALANAPDEYHLCELQSRWELGREDECNVCLANAQVGVETKKDLS